jgi:hypothetical protein
MIEWLEQQNPKRSYNWHRHQACACAQFAKATGRWDAWQAAVSGRDRRSEWIALNRAANGYGTGGWTFGRLLARLKEPSDDYYRSFE